MSEKTNQLVCFVFDMYHQLMLPGGHLGVCPSIVGQPKRPVDLALEDELGILEIVVALVDEYIFKLETTYNRSEGHHCFLF